LPIYKGKVDVPANREDVNVIIADFPLRWTVSHLAPLFDTGVNVVIPNQQSIPAHLLDPKIKSRSRQHYKMADLQTPKGSWPLLTDPDGFLTESTGANVVLIKDGKVFTPEIRNVLSGISLGYVDELFCSGECSFGVGYIHEQDLVLYDLLNADEAFFTATPFCIMPITSVFGRPIGNGKPGEMTLEFIKLWGKDVGVDIVGQIEKWHEEDSE
jgi:branched-chain amino acid aminotransferase